MGRRAGEIIDSDHESRFIWIKWLNPQSGKEYVRARAAATMADNSVGRTFQPSILGPMRRDSLFMVKRHLWRRREKMEN